jgi:hypothetical protein
VSSTGDIDFHVLICVVSLALQPLVLLNIHNQCQNVNLISPVYFVHGGKLHVAPDQEMGASNVIRNSLRFHSGQGVLEGALVYRIQRRQHAESDESVHDELERIRLLVAWCSKYTGELRVCALLIEHDKEFNWDKDKLKELHKKYWYSLDTWVDNIRNKWLLDGTTILTTLVKAMDEGYRWDISISKGTKDNTRRPVWVNTKR